VKPPTKRESTIEDFHAVRFYRDVDSLSRVVGDFLAKGLANGQPAVIIATPLHRAEIVRRLIDSAIDVARLQEECALSLFDAEETLAEFMRDGMPDPTLFRQTIVPMIETAATGRDGAVIHAYGEMVDVLWKAGQTLAATRLEILWNSLRSTHAFSLLCGYAMGNFYKDAAIDEICSHHSHVMSLSGEASLIT
jgi:hypothetical protein